MKRADAAHKLHIELDTKHCEMTPGEIEAMEASLDPLAAVVESFPICDLHITIAFFRHSQEYHVKTTLFLPGGVQFTGEHDNVALPAFERCVRKLVSKVEAFKGRLASSHGEIPKFVDGTRQSIVPNTLPDDDRIRAAVDAGDYGMFRQAMGPFEEPIRRRAGRWVQRYPELDSVIGEGVLMDEIVEEVLLNAFDRFPKRPPAMRLGDWLEGLIDPSIRSLLRHPEEELEQVSFARTVREMYGDGELELEEETPLPAEGRFADVLNDGATHGDGQAMNGRDAVKNVAAPDDRSDEEIARKPR